MKKIHIPIFVLMTFFYLACSNEKTVGIQGDDNDGSIVKIGDGDLTIHKAPQIKRECKELLTGDEIQKFRSQVMTNVVLIRESPMTNPIPVKNNLKPLVENAQSNFCYETHLKQETAMLYRLYGSVLILGTQDLDIGARQPFMQAYVYLEKSFELDKSIWKSKDEKAAFVWLSEAHKNSDKLNFSDQNFIEEYICNVLRTAMILSEEREVVEKCDFFKESLRKMTGSKELIDLKYFLESSVGDGNYETLIEALKLITIAAGGKLEGPVYELNSDGFTLIKFMSKGTPKSASFEWLVDKERNIIRPKTETARIVEQAI